VIWFVRRFVIAPAVVVIDWFLWATAPLWLIGAAALSPLFPGRWRVLRLIWICIVYATMEGLLLLILFGLWLSSGFGRRIRTPYFEGIHYDLVQGTLWLLFKEFKRVLNLTIETVGPTPDAFPGHPLLVCCRHAGPGDSFTLVHALMHDYHREPRVVLKDTLAWDPAIGVLLTRLPARFISPNPGAGEDLESQIAELASNLDSDDAFVIFPEGGNFTPARRTRAIERLRKMGLERMAAKAEAMIHVPGPAPRWLHRRAGCGARRRRPARRPHRPGPPDHGGRPVACAADGQADHHPLVADRALRHPRGTRGTDRLAL
jgi:1-acyl-sn-glycerol-3-phosphate acyltransferase